ncbi:MAG TPA: hypothetical protein VFT51_15165 [Bacillales bacterium]|nr:hypothetical protein [Bacillales bacterium]
MTKKFLTIVSAVMLTCLFIPSQSLAADQKIPIGNLKPATHLEKPVLEQTGGKLILSDSPETYQQEGAFYRDTAKGEFRVFWHHQNRSGETRKVAVAVTNTLDQGVKLYSEGQGASVSIYPDVAGQKALVSFLEDRFEKHYLTTLAPGESYFLIRTADDLDTVSGIAQFAAYTKHGHQPTSVTVTTLNYTDRPSHPEKMRILEGDSHTRGSFPHFNRTGVITYDPAMGNAYIRISSAESGKWSDKLPGEYEMGVDVVDGNKPVVNNGNYGVLYNFTVQIENSLHSPREVTVYENPSGGFGHYVMEWQGHIKKSGFLSYKYAWPFQELNVGADGNDYRFVTSLPGGASGPSVIYFTNTAH